MIKVRKILTAALMAVAMLCACMAAATFVRPAKAAETGFVMQDGAYVKVADAQTGIRFISRVTEDKYSQLVSAYGEENLEFGTLFLPESLVSDESSLTLENVNSAGNPKGAAQVVITKWFKEVGDREFVSALTDVPQEHMGENISARSYVKDKNSSFVEYTNVVSRSIAGVALSAYADESVTDQEIKQTLYDSYLTGRTFAGLGAEQISYNSQATSLSAVNDGIKVTESGENGWKQVKFAQDVALEEGKTYYFSFDLQIDAAGTDCDLYLGAKNISGENLDINLNERDPYKKLASGTVTFTYLAKAGDERATLYIFTNVNKAYKFSYTVNNFKSFNTDYESADVAGGKYTVKLSNDKGDNPKPNNVEFDSQTTHLTQNAVGTVTLRTLSGWQGLYINFGTLPSGVYKLEFKVYNDSGESVCLYSREYLNNVQGNLKDFGTVNNGQSQAFTKTLTVDDPTEYMIRIFSANNGGKSMVKFEVGELKLTRIGFVNSGTLGGNFRNISGTNNTDFNNSVIDSSVYETNVVGTAQCGEGESAKWRGIRIELDKLGNEGEYTISFTVTNRGAETIKMYSCMDGNFDRKVTEHGELNAGETKNYSVEIPTNAETSVSYLTIQVFSMNGNGHTFELGNLKVDFTANQPAA